MPDAAPAAAAVPAPPPPTPGLDVPLVDRRYGWQLAPLGPGWHAVPVEAAGTLAAFAHDDGTVAVIVRAPGPSRTGERAPPPTVVDAALRPRLRGYRRLWARARAFTRPGRPVLPALDVGFTARGKVAGAVRMICHPASTVTLTVELPSAPSRTTRTRLETLLDRFAPPPPL